MNSWKRAVSLGGRSSRRSYCIGLVRHGACACLPQNPNNVTSCTMNEPVSELNIRAFGSLLDTWGIKNVVGRRGSFGASVFLNQCSTAAGYCGLVGDSIDSEEGLKCSSASSNLDDSEPNIADAQEFAFRICGLCPSRQRLACFPM